MSIIPKRFHLFEFCDQPWLTGIFREAYMDCMNSLHVIFKPYKHMHQPLQAMGIKDQSILDICSGGGKHIETILAESSRKNGALPKIILSDLFPQTFLYTKLQRRFGEEKVGYLSGSTDIHQIDGQHRIMMICSALHHFTPQQVQALFENIARQHDAIIIFELNEPKLTNIINSIFGSIIVGVLAPFFAPHFKWQKMLLSIIPVIPFMFMWDGVVSGLRSYTTNEMEQMFLTAEGKGQASSAFTISSGAFLYAPFQHANYFIAQRKMTTLKNNS